MCDAEAEVDLLLLLGGCGGITQTHQRAVEVLRRVVVFGLDEVVVGGDPTCVWVSPSVDASSARSGSARY